jgi:hypothetical protein
MRSDGMTMVKWSERQRELLIEKLADAANLAVAGLLFVQFVSDQTFSFSAAVAGIVVWAGLLGWSLFLSKGR